MSPLFYLFLFIPVGIALFAKFGLKWDISWREFVCQVAVGIISVSIVWSVGQYSAAQDHEIWNGGVTQTRMHHFDCPTNTGNPCQNGYSCHSHQVCSMHEECEGSGKHESCEMVRSCHEEHDTCYTYPWEQDWLVNSSLGEEYKIDRIDRQGRDAPQRWTSTHVGDPTSKTHGYMNWVIAANESLFNQHPEATTTYQRLLVPYPDRIIDYYRIDRFVTPGIRIANAADWNHEIASALVQLGPARQMNMIVVVTEGTQPTYAFALRRAWRGFKKNDAVLFIGLDHGVVSWADVMSWSQNEAFNVETRDYLQTLQGQSFATLKPQMVMAQVRVLGQLFQRRPMATFEYLRGDIPPPGWLIVLATILSIGGSIGLSILFGKGRYFESEY